MNDQFLIDRIVYPNNWLLDIITISLLCMKYVCVHGSLRKEIDIKMCWRTWKLKMDLGIASIVGFNVSVIAARLVHVWAFFAGWPGGKTSFMPVYITTTPGKQLSSKFHQ